ncbi:protein kinase [Calditrichota bacterium]
MEEERRINGYRVDEEIADSPICKVIRGFDEKLDRTVILKKLHPQMTREPDIRDRFEREAKVCAQVKHENIVDIYGYENSPELTMLVLEYVDGPNLAEVITQKGALDWQAVTAIMFAILRGLRHAHNKGVLHRDIKPANILISQSGIVKITDFGLASLEGASKLTQQSGIIGTPAYMSPEQINGAELDRRSDLFSTGATLYEILTGISPFQGESFTETMNKVLNSDLKPPSATIPDIPVDIDQIVMRLLEKQPTKRYASADQALDDLNKFVQREKLTIGKETVVGVLHNNGDTPIIRLATPAVSSSVILPKRKANPVNAFIIISIAIIALIALFMIPTPPPDEQSDTQISENLRNAVELSIRAAAISEQSTSEQSDQPAVAQSDIPVVPDNTNRTSSEQTQTTLKEEPVVKALTGKGILHLSTRPWADISIDNEYFGQTPAISKIELDPGIYEIAFSNDQLPTPVVETVVVEPGQEINLNIDLMQYFTIFRFVNVKPWAEIVIDGVSYGETPRANPIILPLGTHTVELHNPSLETWSETFVSTKGNNEHEIVALLKP